jgi:hypothetical protein
MIKLKDILQDVLNENTIMNKWVDHLNDLLKQIGVDATLAYDVLDVDSIQVIGGLTIDYEEYDELERMMFTDGMVPILAYKYGNEVADGNHRVMILKRKGIKKIPAFVIYGDFNFDDGGEYMKFMRIYSNDTPLVKINDI